MILEYRNFYSHQATIYQYFVLFNEKIYVLHVTSIEMLIQLGVSTNEPRAVEIPNLSAKAFVGNRLSGEKFEHQTIATWCVAHDMTDVW